MVSSWRSRWAGVSCLRLRCHSGCSSRPIRRSGSPVVMPRSRRGPGRTRPQVRAAARTGALSRAEPAAERLRPGQARGPRHLRHPPAARPARRRELAGVLAHEIGHIANRDLWIMSLADMMSRLVSLTSWLGQLLLLVNLPLVLAGFVHETWHVVILLRAHPHGAGPTRPFAHARVRCRPRRSRFDRRSGGARARARQARTPGRSVQG